MFVGVLRNFYDSSVGRWRRLTSNLEIQKQFQNSKQLFCVFVNVRPGILSNMCAPRHDS